MTLDGITLAAAVRELQFVEGAKIEKIQMPAADEILLQLHTQEGKKRLMLSSNASSCRVCLTSAVKKNPPQAPSFCMLLRKHLTGGRITGIRTAGLERIVRVEIEAADEMGEKRDFALVAEIMGKHSNIIALSGETIIGSARRVTFDTSSVRQVLPGMRYEQPPLKPDIREAQESELAGAALPMALVEKFAGVSPAMAREITYRYFGTEDNVILGKAAAEFAQFAADFVRKLLSEPEPVTYTNADGLPVFFAPIPFETRDSASASGAASVNRMIDDFYTSREQFSALSQQKAHLQKAVRKHLTRARKKHAMLAETIASEDRIEKYRVRGELLTANMYRIKRGESSVEVDNYYTGEKERIPMDVKISPAANAQKYFKKYAKQKTAIALAKKGIAAAEDEVKYLEDTQFAIDDAANTEEAAEIKAELRAGGYLPEVGKKQKKKEERRSSPKEFVSSDGFRIFAGRTGVQNDMLTMRMADKTDIWMHARNMPGAHVVIFLDGRELTETALGEAANIAALYSKGKASPKVEIDYCPAGNVWKARGAKPGRVYYEGHRTYVVEPDAALAANLAKETEHEDA